MKIWLAVLAAACLTVVMFDRTVSAADEDPAAKPHHTLKDIIEKADTNHDGKIDKDELAAVKNVKSAERLKKLDTNNDGIIDEDEIKVGLANAAKHAHKNPDAAATDAAKPDAAAPAATK